MIKDLQYYLSLPYTVEVIESIEDDGSKSYFAKVVELSGCMTEAESYAELEEMVAEAKQLWLEVALEEGMNIPEPMLTENFSGKFVLRLPKSLHKDISRRAQAEGVSLNQYAVSVLSRAAGN